MEGADIVVVVAGDLALLRVDHVRQLVDALEAVSSIHAAAAIDDRGLPNPLVAAYRTSALCATAAEVVAGDRADRLLPHNTRVVQLDDDATFSVNTPADLDEARRRISR
jgi:molybdopterin-guanine dinucleotide biosynthesis protein A